MKLTTTLKLLRKNGACIRGYNKVVCALKGVEYEELDSYIDFNHDEEINLLSILESNGVKDCAWALRATVQNSDKISRLLAVAFAREVQHLTQDERSIRALDVAERYANGEATVEELYVAWNAAWEAARNAARDAHDATRAAVRAAAKDATWAACDAAWYADWAVQDADRTATQEKQKEIIKSFLSWS